MPSKAAVALTIYCSIPTGYRLAARVPHETADDHLVIGKAMAYVIVDGFESWG